MTEPMDEIRVDWTTGLKFVGHRAGFETTIDGDQEIGPSPVGLLMESVAACAAIDVVVILEKGRESMTGLSVTTRAVRAEKPPRYVMRWQFDFVMTGEVGESKARRAVLLSFAKYCSVFHSLRKDVELEWSLTLNGVACGGQ